MKQMMIRFLLYLVSKLGYKQEEPKPLEVIQSINRHDVELLSKAFVPYAYKHGASTEEIALSVARSDGEQRVIQYIIARVRGRIGAIHD